MSVIFSSSYVVFSHFQSNDLGCDWLMQCNFLHTGICEFDLCILGCWVVVTWLRDLILCLIYWFIATTVPTDLLGISNIFWKVLFELGQRRMLVIWRWLTREWCGVWPGTLWDIYCVQDLTTTPGKTAWSVAAIILVSAYKPSGPSGWS